MTNATSKTDAARTRTPAEWVGLISLHGITAAWIGYGALMKAIEMNPQLLPSPILKLLTEIAKATPGDSIAFLEGSLRAIIGAEVFLAIAILFSTRYARLLAMLTLGLFCLILMYAMVTTGLKDGWSEALTGSCGCFGEKGLPASVMLAVDALLLANAFFLAPRARAGGILPLGIGAVLGVGVAVLTPTPEVTVTPKGAASETAPVAPTPNVDAEAPATAPVKPPPAPEAPVPVVASLPWPAEPAKYEKIYFPKFKEWVGKPFRDQKLALAISRPMPADIEKGDWIVTFSRPDCDRCQQFYREHFAAPRKERVLKVSIKDSTGKALGMPCAGCEEREVYRAKEAGQRSPEYLLQTPCAVRLKDGVVTAFCTDVDNAEELAKVLDGPAPAAPVVPTPQVQQPAVKPDPATVWPGLPEKFDRNYLPEFAEFVGKRFSEIPFARLIDGQVPADFLKGRWIVIYFREDCDHCHMMLSSYFTGKLPVKTMTLAIPDADPNNIMENPCDECVKLSLVKGPTYIVGTPVVLALNDGVVECVVENVDDMAALEGCLKFPK
jgi:hypothetical protein